jgi:hypothetical protein
MRAIRIQVTEMHDGSVRELIEEKPNSCRVPIRNMSEEPVIGWTQVEIRTECTRKDALILLP